ncbi:MBL fold metallo-hydrolase [Thermocladium modestius]|uniref:MBL fold metallo-hydrolase n=2 Tax=Thermocladium modestius TaxID=62609 RepID=A0A830GUV2_9CREN|nr:MBL fold metallo-hydrolase [Thermocladium modestius]
MNYMRLTFLGVGGWVSSPWLNMASILVTVGNRRILLDAGEGIYRQYRRCTGLDVGDLDLVVLSHGHGDHVLGIPSFALMAGSQNRRLRVIAMDYVVRDIRRLMRDVHLEKYTRFLRLIAASVGDEPRIIYEGNGYQVWASTAAHSIPSMAIKVMENSTGQCIVYSGDTMPSDNVARLARGCNVLIHEISGNPGMETEAHAVGHSTTDDARHIAEMAGVKYLIPIHYYIKNPIINRGRILVPLECSSVDVGEL